MMRPRANGAIGTRYGRRSRVHLCGALRTGIIACGVLSTLGVPVAAQVAAGDAATAAATEISDAPPAPEVAMTCYRAAEGWVRRWRIDPVEVTGLTGAAVTLRMHNRIVGRGRAFAAAGTDPTVLARAVQEAMDEVERRRPVSADALGLAQRVTDASELVISLELAGPLVPFEPVTFAEVDLAVQAGREGIAARIGDRTALIFPSSMLLAGGSAADAACAAISEASGDPMLAIKTAAPSQPANLRKTRDVRLYRFLVTHLAQPSVGEPPAFLFRSGRLVEQREIDAAAIGALKRGLAENLRSRVVSEVDADGTETIRVVGAYSASRGPASAEAASPETAAIVGMALQHYAATLSVESEERADFEWLGGAIAEAAMRMRTPMSPVTAAAVVACIAPECARVSTTRERFEPAFESLLKAVDDVGVWDAGVSSERRGLVAYGLAREAQRGGAYEQAEPFRARANAAIASIMREASPASLMSNMPWVYLAARELRQADPESSPSRLTAFLAFREGVWRSQMTVEDGGTDGPDLVGGFAFVDPKSPLPAADGLRVLPCFAGMLADREATRGEERMPELLRLLRATRFLRQLAIDEWSGYTALDPGTARWGVRDSLWNDELRPETQAIAVLSLCELEAAVGSLRDVPEHSGPVAEPLLETAAPPGDGAGPG